MLASARVVAYAYVDDVPYKKWGSLYAGDTLVEAVPHLAIALNLGNQRHFHPLKKISKKCLKPIDMVGRVS